MLRGKTIVVGITGGIAAYKMANVVSMLGKLHSDVQVIMTEHAVNFIHPITFETLTGSKCLIDTFDRNFQHQVEHVALAKRADLLLIAPATANVIGKLAHGIADDMLTTTALACTCPKIIAPAMNTNMYRNPVVQDNLQILRNYGWEVIEPATGLLACKDLGEGKLPEPEVLTEHVLRRAAKPKDLKGKRILVTAGATMEPLDPVRFLTNHSTGKMGFALARACMLRGADVTLVAAHTEVEPPRFVKLIRAESARDMFEAVKGEFETQEIVIMAAAVADYTPRVTADEKIKKSDGELVLELERTTDILKYLGEHKKAGQFLCGFSMETQHMLENSRAKLQKKNLDMIVANNLKTAGAGFGTDTNVVTMITGQEEIALELMGKEEAADHILDQIIKMKGETEHERI